MYVNPNVELAAPTPPINRLKKTTANAIVPVKALAMKYSTPPMAAMTNENRYGKRNLVPNVSHQYPNTGLNKNEAKLNMDNMIPYCSFVPLNDKM